MVKSRHLLLVSTACAMAMTAQPAMAQDEAGSGSAYQEIIVTARKKQESILRVPVVENVITQEALQDYQINDLKDVTARIPGLVSGEAVLAIGVQMSLRGVGSNALDQGVDQSVSLNVDGLQLTHGNAFRAASFDLAQVEVLKGPQALYFGKNSTAGVISLRSADPGDEVEFKAAVGYEFESKEKRAELIYSTPLSDTVGLRLAGLYTDSKGYFYNRATALPNSGAQDPQYKRYGGDEGFVLRGTLLWEPDADLTVRLKANVTSDKYRPGGFNQLSACPDGTAVPAITPFQTINPNDDCKYDRVLYGVDYDPAYFPNVRNNGHPFLDVDQYFGTLEVDYSVSDALLFTSVTGYYENRTDTMINATNSGYGPPAYFADNKFKRRDFSQEVRLDSDFADSPLNFTVGAFYQDGKMSNEFALESAIPLLNGTSTIDIESFSAFGQGRWTATDQLEIAAGVRWTHEKRGLDVVQIDNFGIVTGTVGAQYDVTLAPGSDRISSKNWSPEFTITYTPTDDLTVFGALKQAYKSGSFNIVIPGNNGQDKSFGDEKVQGGEIGLKSRLLDRALSVDIAGYYYEYSGLQTGVNEPAQGGLPVLRTLNAGKARIHGVDFEAHYRPPSVDGLSLNLAVNWNKTKFTELNNVPCYGGQLVSQGCTELFVASPDQANPGLGAVENPDNPGEFGYFTGQNLKGVPFVRAPEWQANFGFDYEMPVGSNMRLVLTNDNQYSSSYVAILGDPAVRPWTRVPDALKINANLTLYGPEDRWSLSIYGKNLTKKLRAGYCTSLNYVGAQSAPSPLSGGTERNAVGQDEVTCGMSQGRAIGVRFGVNF